MVSSSTATRGQTASHLAVQENVIGAASPSDHEAEFAREVARLILAVQIDAEHIASKVKHVVDTRGLLCDLLRNAEILEDYAAQLQTHARQIVRRALEEQR